MNELTKTFFNRVEYDTKKELFQHLITRSFMESDKNYPIIKEFLIRHAQDQHIEGIKE